MLDRFWIFAFGVCVLVDLFVFVLIVLVAGCLFSWVSVCSLGCRDVAVGF